MKTTLLKLDTDYTINGNSTGCAIDTLCIAVDGKDTNDIYEYNFDYESEVMDYVLKNYDYEADMLKEATKAQLKMWLKEPAAQAEALKAYTDKRKEAIYNNEDESSDLYTEVQDAKDQMQADQYRAYIYGDRDFEGVLSMASKRYSEREIDFSTDKGEVYADIPDTLIAEWVEYGNIDKPTQKEAIEYLENSINTDARREYEKRKEQSAKRKAEYEKTKEYKAKQAQEAEIERQNKLKKLI